ncbi:transporter [Luteibacter sp. 329MFSha]|uniref:transporter n=1 Tax=Luteibacter sp. 329MFSha TaxID=1798239 RepID=UPI0008D09A3C|nr:transporter [Luteibacter sp. 329MFSha]SEW28975.1 Putative MetA-pathway of phenol degradation [Luteibacter sp. 329MFSha]
MTPRPLLAALALAVLSTPTFADPPDFDRPGAGFATTVLPAGTLALEQGLPTYERERSDGFLDRTYTADSVIRLGLGGPVELQVAGSAWNRLEERGMGSRRHATGHGDTSVGLKWASPGSGDAGSFSWAALGNVTFDNGDEDFGNGAREVSLGSTMQWKPDDDHQNTLYANVDHLKGRNTWTLAPTFGRKFGDQWMAYIEADAIHDADEGNELQAGGGLAYTIGDHLQLDAYALHRVAGHGPSFIAGLGVSMFFGRKS